MIRKPNFLPAATLACLLLPALATLSAQDRKEPATNDTSSTPTHGDRRAIPADFVTRTYTLPNIASEQDANEILIALRNTLEPFVHMFLLSSQNTIVIAAPPDQQALAARLITELDRPTKAYRLLYTLTELDNGQRVGTRHYSMVVVDGQRTQLKEGDKVPVATGSYTTQTSSSQTQFTYLDVGINIDASLAPYADGARLKSKVEQSSVGPTSTVAGVQEPVVRQSVLEGSAFLSPGKPVLLGSIDVPNSTRRIDVSVELQPAS